jgi:type I restriction enzyme S subunit
MSDWRELRLGDVLTLQRGFDITRANQREGNVPVVSSSGINSYHAEAMVQAPGVVIGRKGTLGSCFFLEQPFWPHDTTLWIRDFQGNDPHFCYFLLKSLNLAKYDVGAANPTLNRNHLHLVQTRCPSLPVQRRIAGILGSYDELIDVNQRRIALLEQMARRLFDEWFVRDCVSSKAAAEFNAHLLGEVAEIQWGDTATTKASYVPKGYVAYSASGPDGFMDHYDHEGLGIVLSAIGAQCGKIWLADGRWSCIKNTIFLKARHEKTTTRILYLVLSREDVWPKRGAAQPFISQGDARKVVLRLPTFDVQSRFDELVAPMLDQCRTLEQANKLLVCARDLLLPRLMSGELSISAAERELETAA